MTWRRDWLLAMQAVMQTRQSNMAERNAWLTFAMLYLAADRMSLYRCPNIDNRLMLHKQAAHLYEYRLGERRARIYM